MQPEITEPKVVCWTQLLVLKLDWSSHFYCRESSKKLHQHSIIFPFQLDKGKLASLNLVFTFLKLRYVSTVFQRQTINYKLLFPRSLLSRHNCPSAFIPCFAGFKNTGNREQVMMSTVPHISSLKYTGVLDCLAQNLCPELTRKILF